MELAAMATAAVPGLSPTGVAAAADDARDFTSAIVVDVEGGRWRVRSPQHQEAAMRLETELQVLRGFSTGIRAELPFRLPSVAGAVRRGELRTFVYNHLPGDSAELEELNRGPAEMIDDIGATIAAIHDLDENVVDDADLPRYSAERFRQRRLNELDQAATTGQIPSTLLRRWEHAMEERELWDFTPTVTHGDLHEDALLIDEQRVVAVTGWTDLHIGDPAADFAWLTASPEVEFSDAVLAAYRSHRRGPSDPHLMRRAALSAEFALAQWLVRGHATENQEMVDEARELLRQLEEDVLAHGGQPISLSSPDTGPTDAVDPAGASGQTDQAGHAGTQDSKPVARPGAAATVADTGDWSDSGVGDDEPAVITDASADEPEHDAPLEEADEETGEEAGDSSAGTAAPATEPRPQSEPDAERSPSVADEGAQHTAPVPRPQQPAAAEEQPTGEIPPLGSGAPDDGDAALAPDEQPTGAFPAVAAEEPEHTAESAENAETTETTETTGPITGELPIAPDEDADRRAREKRFFPSQSSYSAEEPEDAAEPAQQEEQEDATSEPEAPSSSSRPSRLTDTSDSVYSTFPGLRPPKS
ncbi:hypothetical protein GCM10020260_02580 [Nesterenkonia halobia]|uniref:Aminoglycoside phosphotransferase domain-containing protein n=2 Tax=Nesterenkonia halobia TaxID=37922 RepID=A0ABP6R8N1_9MICC